jgi:hypothetical protein
MYCRKRKLLRLVCFMVLCLTVRLRALPRYSTEQWLIPTICLKVRSGFICILESAHARGLFVIENGLIHINSMVDSTMEFISGN